MGAKWFGSRVVRKEDPALLTGNGRFVDDIVLPELAHVAFLRSPFAHARIENIDARTAKEMSGVHAVLTYADLPDTLQQRALPMIVPSPLLTQECMPHALARGEVNYVGQVVALIVADSRAIAEDAAEAVLVDYSPRDAVADIPAALENGGATVHDGANTNTAARIPIVVGDADATFKAADHVFKETILQHRGGPFFMECRGAIASWDATFEQLTFFVSSQGSHRLKRAFLDMFDLDDSQVRVTTPDVGGGFGPKGSFYPEYAALVAASIQTGRPVKWIEDRRENFVATHHERDQVWHMEIATDDAGRIKGVRGELIHDMGAFTPWGIVLPWITATTVPGPYVLPAFDLQVHCVLTNKVPTTPVRGAGRPQAAVTMERLMDLVAGKLDIDPAEVRRRNFIQPDQMPYQVGIIFRDGRPVTYDSGDYPACQQAALDAIDYEAFRERQANGRKEGRYLGLGIGNAVEATGLGPYEGATCKVATNGKIVVYTGATPQGQSHKTTLAQIAADELGVTPDDIRIVTGDSGHISLGVGTFAARTAVNAGSSVHLASKAVAQRIREIAGELFQMDADDMELAEGYVHPRGRPESAVTFKEIAVKSIGMPGFSMADGPDPGLENTAYFRPDRSAYANGTTVCEVEVDIETGRVTIQRLVIAHDCGRVINPAVVDGQVVGGVAHGIGNALYERMIYDEDANPLTTNFGEYLLPLATDVPRVDIVHQETPSPLNPLGLKGAGEGGTIPTIAAVHSAINDALRPFGVVINDLPASPQAIVSALGEAAFGRTQ